jgi:hypothetical protein
MMVSLAVLIPLGLGACGDSDSTGNAETKGEASKAFLRPSDIDAAVKCAPWEPNPQFGNLVAECDVIVENRSAASGVIFVSWDWMSGDKRCGGGVSKTTAGDPANINIGPYESSVFRSPQSPYGCFGQDWPEPTNITVQVR